jgi:AraC family transcriptional regulator
MKQMMIQEVLDYIDTHIEEDLTIEELADVARYSRFYLHRMFDLLIGMSIMTYVRLRKMQYARTALSKGYRVLDVALMYAYQSERSFRRAFQQVFHVTPSQVKNQVYHTPEKIQFEFKKGMNMINYLSDLQVVNCPMFYAIGTTVISKEPEIDSIHKMTKFKHDHHIDPTTEIGLDVAVSVLESDQGKRGYMYYLVVDQGTFEQHNSPILIKKSVESSKYARLTIEDPFRDPFERIPMGWKKLMQEIEDQYTTRKDLAITWFEEKVDTLTGTVMHLYVAIE